MPEISAITALTGPAIPKRDQPLWQVAQKLEATFLAETLKSSGVGAPSESFGGGQGEEQFGSFLRQAQADLMVQAGGIGLAESLFESLKDRTDGSF